MPSSLFMFIDVTHSWRLTLILVIKREILHSLVVSMRFILYLTVYRSVNRSEILISFWGLFDSISDEICGFHSVCVKNVNCGSRTYRADRKDIYLKRTCLQKFCVAIYEFILTVNVNWIIAGLQQFKYQFSGSTKSCKFVIWMFLWETVSKTLFYGNFLDCKLFWRVAHPFKISYPPPRSYWLHGGQIFQIITSHAPGHGVKMLVIEIFVLLLVLSYTMYKLSAGLGPSLFNKNFHMSYVNLSTSDINPTFFILQKNPKWAASRIKHCIHDNSITKVKVE